jgi:hypothetical protein
VESSGWRARPNERGPAPDEPLTRTGVDPHNDARPDDGDPPIWKDDKDLITTGSRVAVFVAAGDSQRMTERDRE